MMHYGVVCTEAGIQGEIHNPPYVTTAGAKSESDAQGIARQLFAQKTGEYAKECELTYAHYDETELEFKVYGHLMVCVIAVVCLDDGEGAQSQTAAKEERR